MRETIEKTIEEFEQNLLEMMKTKGIISYNKMTFKKYWMIITLIRFLKEPRLSNIESWIDKTSNQKIWKRTNDKW